MSTKDEEQLAKVRYKSYMKVNQQVNFVKLHINLDFSISAGIL